MNPKLFWMNWSIDCEATQHAVNDAALGSRGAAGYADILDANGLKGNFFTLPGDLESNPAFYRSLPARGHEVGLHLHPAEEGYCEFAGVMGPEEQSEVTAKARDRWAQVMGMAPLSFCMGYASANDYTYAVLEELGFRYGQVSLPGKENSRNSLGLAGGASHHSLYPPLQPPSVREHGFRRGSPYY